MLVTLDVSKLSGWLNAWADCRFAPKHVEGTRGCEARGRVAAVAVHTRRARRNRLDTENGTHGGVRTLNMPSMVVTLDVSKLSGWLNAYANCRVAPRHIEGTGGDGGCLGDRGRCDGARSVHGETDSTLGTARARGCARKTCCSCP